MLPAQTNAHWLQPQTPAGPLAHTHLDLVKGLADARQLDEDVVGAAVLNQPHLIVLGAAPLDGLGLHDLREEGQQVGGTQRVFIAGAGWLH